MARCVGQRPEAQECVSPKPRHLEAHQVCGVTRERKGQPIHEAHMYQISLHQASSIGQGSTQTFRSTFLVVMAELRRCCANGQTPPIPCRKNDRI